MGEGHHRILGTTTDFLSGETITDTDDERYRQKIARFLVERRGYSKDDVRPRHRIAIDVPGLSGFFVLDFLVVLDGRPAMALQYGPGSLVTREHPAIGAARAAGPTVAPVAVVSNGEDAEVLNVFSGRVVGTGFDAIPSRDALRAILQAEAPRTVTESMREKSLRVLAAFESVEHSCGCTEDWCRPTGGGGKGD